MTRGSVYLDYAATTPVKPQVAQAMAEALTQVGNPSSVHGFGRAARGQVENARAEIAKALNATSSQVLFTSGATEANNTAIHAFRDRQLVISAVEHPSITQTAEAYGNPRVIGVDGEGVMNLNQLEDTLKSVPKAFVSVMLANNETGVVQPIKEVTALCKKYGAVMHCDAVQAPGKIPVDFADTGADMLSLSAHKLGGPQGIGALLIADSVKPEPLMLGGSQESRRRGGTENVADIVGFGVAAGLLASDLEKAATWDGWRNSFEASICSKVPKAKVYGRHASRLPTFSCISMPGVRNDTQLMALDLKGYAISTGSACSSGKVQASTVLRAMGISEEDALTAIRVSFGWATGPEQLEKLAQTWLDLYQHISKQKAA